MHRRRTYGIVDMQTMVDELNGIDKHDATNESDNDGSDR